MKKIIIFSLFFIACAFIISACSNYKDNVWKNIPIENSWAIVVGSWKALSSSVQEIIQLQMKKWPDAILDLNCSTYDAEWKAFCERQKKVVNEWKAQVTWKSVLEKWPEYIKTFDCNDIVSTYGKKYCIDYKDKLARNELPSIQVTPTLKSPAK